MTKICNTLLTFSLMAMKAKVRKQFVGNRRNCLAGLRLLVLALSAGVCLSAIQASRVATATAPENIRLFADARRATPKNLFQLGETVWAVGTGMSVSLGQQRRFQWIAPDGTVVRQSTVVAVNQMDAYSLTLKAEVGTWTVKTVDQNNDGFAVATFIVRDPRPNKAVVNLSVGGFAPNEVAAGQPTSYEFSVFNNGPDDAQNVRLTVEMASGTTFQSLAEAKGWTCAKPTDSNGGTLVCTIPLLASSASATFKINYQVNENVTSETALSHTATITSEMRESNEIDNTLVTMATVERPACALNCPSDVTQSCDKGKSGGVVNYAPPTPSAESCNEMECNPPSGSFFPAGVTTVTCSSLAGRECRFNVRLIGAVSIALNGPERMLIERHSIFIDPGATAQNDSGKAIPVTASGKVEPQTPGSYIITYTTNDGAYTAIATRTVQVVDTTPPRMSCPANIVAPLAPGTPAQTSVVNFSLLATDSGERLLVTTTPASGSNFPLGTTMVEATAADVAGNKTACTFTVTMVYRFTGLVPSFNNPQENTQAQASKDLPVKFSLSGNKGFNFFAPGYPATGVMSCKATMQPSEAQTVGTANYNLFSYDPLTDQYTYLWKTEPAWAGTCRQLMFKFTDGTEYRANFIFK